MAGVLPLDEPLMATGDSATKAPASIYMLMRHGAMNIHVTTNTRA